MRVLGWLLTVVRGLRAWRALWCTWMEIMAWALTVLGRIWYGFGFGGWFVMVVALWSRTYIQHSIVPTNATLAEHRLDTLPH